ncbi:MAG: hypothetical protein K0Q77_1671 [Anaerosporomusa subterranea]|jgi:UDP-N-acetylglucosamine 2-epimerase (hydrolysing)|nr:hypothetical protein [Anaerosporomusa subterranea]
MSKNVLFLTGTRADFGKLKPLMFAVEDEPGFNCRIFVTGMHTMAKYGYTVDEVYKSGFKDVHVYMNQILGEPMDLILANTIGGLSRYIHEHRTDMLIVHGDRVEALAGAIVGAINNILVAHIEGGEVSGTIDELIRHSVSKLSHVHFVSNEEAANRLIQMGENNESVFVIGSPDVDIMLSNNLPTLTEVRQRYDIGFEEYGIVLFHTVTTEKDDMFRQANELISALVKTNKKYVVIYPNNDDGNEHIFLAYDAIKEHPNFRLFPSLRFEYFLTLLKQAQFIIGNSSAGVREAPIYGVPTINLGSRQQNRVTSSSIINLPCERAAIINAINQVEFLLPIKQCYHFGTGKSTEEFLRVLRGEETWKISKQKQFIDATAMGKARISKIS